MQYCKMLVFDAEAEAIQRNQPLLAKSHLIAGRLTALLGRVLGSFGVRERAPSLEAASYLFTKVANDLRCVYHLALLGYPQQALTVVVSMLESSYTLLELGNNDEKGRRWLDHGSKTKSYQSAEGKGVKGLIVSFYKLAMVEDPEGAAEQEYLNYQHLCMEKHSNPIVQQLRNVTTSGETLVHKNGPDTTPEGAFDSLQAMYQATRYMQLSLLALFGHFARKEQYPDEWAEFVELGRMQDEIKALLLGKREEMEGSFSKVVN